MTTDKVRSQQEPAATDCAVLRAALEYDPEEVTRLLSEFTMSDLIYLRSACRLVMSKARLMETQKRIENGTLY